MSHTVLHAIVLFYMKKNFDIIIPRSLYIITEPSRGIQFYFNRHEMLGIINFFAGEENVILQDMVSCDLCDSDPLIKNIPHAQLQSRDKE